MSTPSIAQLQRAIQIQEQIATLEAELKSVLNGATSTTAPAKASPVAKAGQKKRTVSAAGRANIIAAQKARWAKSKGTKPTVEPSAASKPAKRGMSAAHKAKLKAAAKKRWAAIKAGKAPNPFGK